MVIYTLPLFEDLHHMVMVYSCSFVTQIMK